MMGIWDFIQNQILGMRWLHDLVGAALSGLSLDINTKIGGRSLLKMSIVFHRYSGKSKVEEPFCTDFYADIGILPLF